ncbi:MAG: hypothetical protein IPJ77_15755 [Planctomycetes bacterium]|nr:hypothetical protein [Planctomycetota bacterium]
MNAHSIVGLISMVVPGACSSMQRVDGPKFLELVQGGMLNTAWSARLLALTDERAYLGRKGRVFGSATIDGVTVLWVPLSELAPGEVAELEAALPFRTDRTPWSASVPAGPSE